MSQKTMFLKWEEKNLLKLDKVPYQKTENHFHKKHKENLYFLGSASAASSPNQQWPLGIKLWPHISPDKQGFFPQIALNDAVKLLKSISNMRGKSLPITAALLASNVAYWKKNILKICQTILAEDSWLNN